MVPGFDNYLSQQSRAGSGGVVPGKCPDEFPRSPMADDRHIKVRMAMLVQSMAYRVRDPFGHIAESPTTQQCQKDRSIPSRPGI